jgi:hypothetical protein
MPLRTQHNRVWTITLRRIDGRFVKESTRTSKYAAKKLRQQWEDLHDEAHYVEVTQPRERP